MYVDLKAYSNGELTSRIKPNHIKLLTDNGLKVLSKSIDDRSPQRTRPTGVDEDWSAIFLGSRGYFCGIFDEGDGGFRSLGIRVVERDLRTHRRGM